MLLRKHRATGLAVPREPLTAHRDDPRSEWNGPAGLVDTLTVTVLLIFVVAPTRSYARSADARCLTTVDNQPPEFDYRRACVENSQKFPRLKRDEYTLSVREKEGGDSKCKGCR